MQIKDQLLIKVSEITGIPVDEISEEKAKNRKREVVLPRQIVMYILKSHYNMTFKQVGREFGKDHTTAIHSFRTVKDFLSTNDERAVSIYSQMIEVNANEAAKAVKVVYDVEGSFEVYDIFNDRLNELELKMSNQNAFKEICNQAVRFFLKSNDKIVCAVERDNFIKMFGAIS